MGGGNSKKAQLDRYGQDFSEEEKKCLSKTFHLIAGYEEATYFSAEEFKVKLIIKRKIKQVLYG